MPWVASSERGVTHTSSLRAGTGVVLALLLCPTVLVPAFERRQTDFSYDALSARMPVVMEHSYTVNAKVRPLLAFWIGRDDVGDARLTWRKAAGEGRGYELLIGSDPTRAPRHVNRWGFIVEELDPDKTEVLGIMRESDEDTIEAAEAQIARTQGVCAFKASRTTITGNQVLNGAVVVQAPSHLTYRARDAILGLIPSETSRPTHRMELPPGTQKGFLVAMDSLIQASVTPCRARKGARQVAVVPFVYGHTLFDLSLSSCSYEPQLKTKSQIFADVIDGRFQVRNRTTGNETRFRVAYGTSSELRGVPVRAVFRPRWWMELELLLDNPAREKQ